MVDFDVRTDLEVCYALKLLLPTGTSIEFVVRPEQREQAERAVAAYHAAHCRVSTRGEMSPGPPVTVQTLLGPIVFQPLSFILCALVPLQIAREFNLANAVRLQAIELETKNAVGGIMGFKRSI